MNATRLPLLVLACGLVAASGLAASASSVAANGTAAAPSTTAAPRKVPAAKHVLPFIDDDLARALAEARQTNRPVFVESWAPW